MPESKSDAKISLTKTPKKGIEKEDVVVKIRKFLQEYDHLFVFTVSNMRNTMMKSLREEGKSNGRFLFAKKEVLWFALRSTEAKEVKKNLYKVSGQFGLFFTKKPKEEVIRWLNDFSSREYARCGFVPVETVTLPAGPLPLFRAPIEPHLRTLGLPTNLVNGVVMLQQDHTVCTQGQRLNLNQAQLLKLMGNHMVEFKVILLCVWSKDGSIQKFKIPEKLGLSSNAFTITDKDNKDNLKVKDATPKQDKTTEKSTTKQDKKTPKKTPKQDKTTPKTTPKQDKTTPKSVGEQDITTSQSTTNLYKTTPKSTQKHYKTTPKSAPKQSTLTPQSTPNIQKQELKSNKSSEKVNRITPITNKVNSRTPKKGPQTTDKNGGIMDVKLRLITPLLTTIHGGQTKENDKMTPRSTSNIQKQEFESGKSSERAIRITPMTYTVESKTPQKVSQIRDVDCDEMEVDRPQNTIEKRNLRRSVRTPKPLNSTIENTKESVMKLTAVSAKQLKRTPAKQTPNSKANNTPRAASAKKTKVV